MKILGPMHLSLLALAIINMIPPVEAEDSWGILAIAAASAVGSGLWFRASGGRPPSPWLTYAGVLAATGYLIYEMFYPQQEQTVHIIDLSHFIIFLCCCKFFDLQTYRDAGLIALIAFILMVISAFVTASPLFALAAIIDVTIGIAWLLHFHTAREAHAVAARQDRALRRAMRPQNDRAALKRVSVRPHSPTARSDSAAIGIKRTVTLCSFSLAGMAAVVFILAPRGWKGGVFSRMHGLVPAAVTGFNDAVELTNNPVTEDESTVMRVRFTRGDQIIVDEQFQPYMRGMTFDEYFRGRWQRPRTIYPRVLSDGSMETPLPTIDLREPVPTDRQIRQDVWIESIGSGVLFSLYPPLTFASSDVGRVHVDRRDMTMEAASTSRKSAHYAVCSAIEPILPRTNMVQRRGGPPVTDRSIIPRRVMELARTLVPQDFDPAAPEKRETVAAAIRDYLLSSRFEYTLDRGGAANRDDPITDFLFEVRRGHCEYFASAMTLLCQSIGIPARLVTGYLGGECNHVGGFYQFRRKDAHAWVEVWLPEKGWTLFDPTPASAVERAKSDRSLWAAISRMIDYLRFTWSTSVVSFDERNRVELIESIGDWLASLLHGSRKQSVSQWLVLLLWGPEFFAPWQRALYWLLLILFAALGVLAMRVAWILSLMVRELLPRRRRFSRSIIRQTDAKFYDRMIVLLANKGHVKPPNATPLEFAKRLSRAHHDLRDVPEYVEWFYEIQYGGRALGKRQWETLRHFLQQLREDPSFGAA